MSFTEGGGGGGAACMPDVYSILRTTHSNKICLEKAGCD